MRINHQINLFFEYRMTNRLITKLEKGLETLKNMKGLAWERKRDIDEKALNKWITRKNEILEEWNSKCDYSIEDFPYIKEDEIQKYYNHPSRKNDRNPFLDYYK